MKVSIIVSASLLLFSSLIFAQNREHPLGGGVKLLGNLVQYANLEGLKLNVDRAIVKQKDTLLKELGGTQNGAVFDVAVYEFNGAHWTAGPTRLGGTGPTPLAAALPYLRDLAKSGSWDALPPKGYQFSPEKSYLIWVTAKGDSLETKKTVGAFRGAFYSKVNEEIAK